MFVVLGIVWLPLWGYLGVLITSLLASFFLIVLWMLIKTTRSLTEYKLQDLEVIGVTKKGVLLFLPLYFVPCLFPVDYNALVGLGTLWMVLAVVYIQSNYLAYNPFLRFLFGYKIFVATWRGRTIYVLAKHGQIVREEGGMSAVWWTRKVFIKVQPPP